MTEPATLVYVGTYTHKGAKGIYIFRLDPSCGALEPIGTTTGVENPSFLAVDPQRRYLFAVNETSGDLGGSVSAFAIDPQTGELAFLNRQPSHGKDPCHLSVDRTGEFVLVANYSSGSLAVLPIGPGGQLGEATHVIQHQGAGVNPKRQEGPHAHSITLDAANRYAFAADLGIDKVMIYRLDLAQGKLIPNDVPWLQVRAGAGPRHFAFHPTGRYAYLINELDSTLTTFAYDPAGGVLRALQTLSTLPKGFQGHNQCADVHVSPSGEYVYGSNRGHDSIVIYRVDQETGQLAYIAHEPTQGSWPRNFAIDPTGSLLLAANEDGNTIVAFHVDPRNGMLTPTGQVTHVPAPVCVQVVTLRPVGSW